MEQTNEGEQNQEDIYTQSYKDMQQHENINGDNNTQKLSKRGHEDNDEENTLESPVKQELTLGLNSSSLKHKC
eukprot:7385918-Heterocapsa_arctica.AAC.1